MNSKKSFTGALTAAAFILVAALVVTLLLGGFSWVIDTVKHASDHFLIVATFWIALYVAVFK